MVDIRKMSKEELEAYYPDIDDDDYEIYELKPEVTGWKSQAIWSIVRLGDKLDNYTIVRVGQWLARKFL